MCPRQSIKYHMIGKAAASTAQRLSAQTFRKSSDTPWLQQSKGRPRRISLLSHARILPSINRWRRLWKAVTICRSTGKTPHSSLHPFLKVMTLRNITRLSTPWLRIESRQERLAYQTTRSSTPYPHTWELKRRLRSLALALTTIWFPSRKDVCQTRTDFTVGKAVQWAISTSRSKINRIILV